MRSVLHAPWARAVASAILAFTVLGAAPAEARDRDRDHRRPTRCDVDHDHRSHARHYYDYYDADKYYRAGPYRGASVTVTYGNRGRHHYSDSRYPRRYDNRYRRYGSDVVYRDVIPLRGRARVVVVEEVIYGRRRAHRVCTVSARGPDAYYVPDRRIRRIAYDRCSPSAEIRIRRA